ncbi:MAG: hypothetical protein KDD69_06635 [Bdellovibrionales bacterium]|nr:hypothetical protein [Bdellovibrionales bacterium]
MFFSSRLIEELVLDVGAEEELDRESLQNLIYHLKLPGGEIPQFIASVIAQRPAIGRAPSPFSPRLACGILDDGWSCFDEDERQRDHVLLCRQVARIALGLQRLEHPLKVIQVFEELFTLMVFASNALHDLGVAERKLTNAELSTLVERIIEAIMVQNGETRMVLDTVVRRLRRAEKNRMKDRVRQTIDEGLGNEPWNDQAALVPLFDLNGPVRFRRSLLQDQRFTDAARTTCDYVHAI